MNFFSAVIGFFLLVPFSYGQLTVKPTASQQDSYLYLDGALLFVNQNVNLQKNAEASPTEASIYFRNEAQLIQGEAGTSANTGNGLVSIFQEGTSNAYDYNYWSSPVGNGATGNGNFGIGMFYAPQTPTFSIPAHITNSLDGNASPLTISSRWIYTFSGTGYSDWKAIFSETSILPGWGFSMKGVNGRDLTIIDGRVNNPGNSQRYDFRGRPNNGPIEISVAAGEHILLGNPFPSALDLSLFLLENSYPGDLVSSCYGSIKGIPVSTGIAYFWDSVEEGSSHYLADYVGGYGAFSPVDPCTTGIYEKPVFRSYGPSGGLSGGTGKHYNRRFLPVGQGFMIKTKSTSRIRFTNHQRIFKKEGEYSDFKAAVNTPEKKELLEIPKIRIEAVINDHYRRPFTLAFWPAASPDTDMGMDAQSYDLAPTDIGWLHEESNYVIEVRPFSETEEIPLFLKVDDQQAKIRIEVSALEHIALENLYMLDSEYGLYYPIIGNAFQVILPKGVYHGRYSICFIDKSRKTSPEVEESGGDLKFYQNNREGRLEIYNPGLLEIESVFLYDLTGKKLVSLKESVAEFLRIPTTGFANSFYIVKVLLKDQREISKQVNIQNPD